METEATEKKQRSKERMKFLMSVPQFAKEKGVAENTVKYHISRGNIEVYLIGLGKDRYIDWRYYKNFSFDKKESNAANN